jgi:hypothetical protein
MQAQDDAALNIEATNQGILVPRIELTSTLDVITIPNASTSLLVYNTVTQNNVSPGFYYWDGTMWIRIGEDKGHYIGELWGGGIVFNVYDHGQHGLIASLYNLGNGDPVTATWGLNTVDVPNCESMTDGESNTAAIVASGVGLNRAAGICDTFSAGGYNDWYLPSNRELHLLASKDILIDLILDNDGDPNTSGLGQEHTSTTSFGQYWSSTEYGTNTAWLYQFNRGYSTIDTKATAHQVRAVRAF